MSRWRRKKFLDLGRYINSISSDSSNSDIAFSPVGLVSNRAHKRKYFHNTSQKRDFLSRLFEKKKLKDKSLSKKIKTPFDRKLNRTCWPIEISKVSKIKKKQKEKKKEKPTNKSLKKKKFSNPTFNAKSTKLESSSQSIDSSGTEIHSEDSYDEILRNLNNNHFLYESVTPQMLIDVLQDPEHLNSGATLSTIIAKLRALKLELNPTLEMLKKEILQTLDCAMKLGLVVESNGYYRIADTFRMSKLPKKKVDAFWELWYRKVANCKFASKH